MSCEGRRGGGGVFEKKEHSENQLSGTSRGIRINSKIIRTVSLSQLSLSKSSCSVRITVHITVRSPYPIN